MLADNIVVMHSLSRSLKQHRENWLKHLCRGWRGEVLHAFTVLSRTTWATEQTFHYNWCWKQGASVKASGTIHKNKVILHWSNLEKCLFSHWTFAYTKRGTPGDSVWVLLMLPNINPKGLIQLWWSIKTDIYFSDWSKQLFRNRATWFRCYVSQYKALMCLSLSGIIKLG